MARPRKPTAVLDLVGAFKKDPQRKAARVNEPQSCGPIGEPPLHFSEELKPLWKELVSLAPAGVLTVADRWTVEVACRMMLLLRQPPTYQADDASGTLVERPAWGSAEVNALMRCLGSMGLTPVDRSKVSVPQKIEEQNTFASLAAEIRTNRPN
jgi:hypothetical protein